MHNEINSNSSSHVSPRRQRQHALRSWVADDDRDTTTGLEGGGYSSARGSTTILDTDPVVRKSWWEIALSRRLVGTCQGIFNIVTGLWPVVHYPSFMAVTGPKTDLWLLQTFGAYIAAVGAVLWLGSRLASAPRVLAWLGGLTAAALAVSDIVFVLRGSIGRVYLWDAAAECALLIWWGMAYLGPRWPTMTPWAFKRSA